MRHLSAGLWGHRRSLAREKDFAGFRAHPAQLVQVSGTDFAGYRADPAQLRRVVGGAQLRQAVGGAQLRQVGGGARRGARMTQLWNAATNDEVSLQNLGGRHRWDMSKKGQWKPSSARALTLDTTCSALNKEKAFYAPVLGKDHNRPRSIFDRPCWTRTTPPNFFSCFFFVFFFFFFCYCLFISHPFFVFFVFFFFVFFFFFFVFVFVFVVVVFVPFFFCLCFFVFVFVFFVFFFMTLKPGDE
ncbi:hypothetical protein T484DRAFT_1768092 [Baffinella frigidus]|nr:hypothetical protein T484DRAFT_1768092 [Cryptophyta sp. CCMP2293]